MSSHSPEVVVTGLGAFSPIGSDAQSTWRGALAGESGIRSIHEQWAAQISVQVVAPAAGEPSNMLERTLARRTDRAEQLAILAAREAWADAGLDSAEPDTTRIAVVVGTGMGGLNSLFTQHDIRRDRGPRQMSPYTVPMTMPNGPAAWVGLEVGARAGVHSVSSACASGAEAIARGLELLRARRADVVIAGGTEACIHPSPVTAFAAMRALSTCREPERASRPFDKRRNGFVLGEGAAIVVLEREEHAKARNARCYARLSGAGITSDAHHIVAPDPSGAQAAEAIRLAMDDAGLPAKDVVHVNAHATSTVVGDIAEIVAIEKVVGTEAVLTAPKSLTGHLLGAAGALEAIITALTIHHSLIPPTLNLEEPEARLTMDVVTSRPRQMSVPAAVTNSFGFGGHNVALALRQM